MGKPNNATASLETSLNELELGLSEYNHFQFITRSIDKGHCWPWGFRDQPGHIRSKNIANFAC